MAMVDSVVLGRCHALIISLCRNARLMKHNPRDKTAYLTTVPNEIIDRVSCFLDGPDKAALAVTCSKLYLSLQCDLAKMPAWETAECSRRLKRGGYFKRQQLPCFSCAEMHPMSNFYSPELNQPLPQCIAKCRMWCCACKSVTAQEIQAAAQLDPARTSPRANDMRDLFDPCQSCHDDEGLCCVGTVVGGAPITLSIVHKIKFQVPHIGLNTTVLLKAVAARCRTFALPLCRHITLADSRVLEAFDSTCHGSGVACPMTCQTRQHQHHIKPLAACPMKGCGLKFGISQEYLGHMDESWNVTITISRRLPSFNEHLKRDRAWSSLAFTNAELSKLLPGVFSTPRSGSDDVLALVRSHLFRNTGWEYDRKMLRQFMKGKGWIGEIGAGRDEQRNNAAHSA